jgi:hypothetical protein
VRRCVAGAAIGAGEVVSVVADAGGPGGGGGHLLTPVVGRTRWWWSAVALAGAVARLRSRPGHTRPACSGL